MPQKHIKTIQKGCKIEKNFVFRIAFVDDAILASILSTIFDDFNAGLAKETLIFCWQAHCFEHFPKNKFSSLNLDFGAFLFYFS